MKSATAMIKLFSWFYESRGESAVRVTSKAVRFGGRPLELGDRLCGVSILGMSLEPFSSVVGQHLRSDK